MIRGLNSGYNKCIFRLSHVGYCTYSVFSTLKLSLLNCYICFSSFCLGQISLEKHILSLMTHFTWMNKRYINFTFLKTDPPRDRTVHSDLNQLISFIYLTYSWQIIGQHLQSSCCPVYSSLNSRNNILKIITLLFK